MKRRDVIRWTARLLLGAALGFGMRMLWERKPAVRFATGLAMHSLRGPAGDESTQVSHLQAGVPVRFSLDEITAAAEPAAALRSWREAFAAATPEARQRCLSVPVKASLTALRRCVTLLARDQAFREEIGRFTEQLAESGGGGGDPELFRRSFVELARMDAGLALDGAEASGLEDVKQAVWAVIAEDDPQRVLDLVATGQAPAEVGELALASLAARSPEAAEAVFEKLPEDEQAAAFEPLARALGATDPINALSRSLDEDGRPDAAWVELLAKHVPATKAVDFLLAIEKDHPDLLNSCGNALSILASEQACRDPEFALGWFRRCVTPGPNMPSWTREMLGEVALHQPRAAAEALAAWPASSARQEASAHIAGAWMQRRPLEALEWMGRQGDSAALLEQAAGAPQIKEQDAAAIAGWFSAHGKLTDLGWSATRIAGAWAADDPAAAMAWAQTLPDAKQRDAARGAALDRWMALDPTEAEARLRAQVAGNPGAVLSALGGLDAPKDPSFNKVVLENLPSLIALSATDEEARLGLQASLAGAAALRDTREAAFDALANLPDPAWRQSVLSAVAGRSANDLSLVRRVTGMMTDQAEATRLMENAVQRAIFR